MLSFRVKVRNAELYNKHGNDLLPLFDCWIVYGIHVANV